MIELKTTWPMSGTIHTASQHLHMAKILRQGVGKPGYPSKEKAEEMALAQEHIARMIKGRWARHLATKAADMAHRATPAEHREMAKELRSYIGNPDAASPERLEQMAREHEAMAAVREGKAILAKAGGSITDHKSPSIIPGLPEVEKLEPPPPARSQGKPKRAAPYQLRFPGF
jgi:hypothetical protein